MNRTILAVVIACGLLLFVGQYASFVDRIRPAPAVFFEDQAKGQFDLRLICTFDCRGNNFGIPAARVQFRGNTILEVTETLAAGESAWVRDVKEIKQGLNEFSVLLNPVDSKPAASSAFSLDPISGHDGQPSTGTARCVRIEIVRNDQIIESRQVWSETPGPIGELVLFEIDDTSNDERAGG